MGRHSLTTSFPSANRRLRQRLPIRVTLKPTGGEAFTYDVVGTASLSVKTGDTDDN